MLSQAGINICGQFCNMRIFNFLLAVTFIVMASIHTQGTNAWLWILLFGTMAVFSVMAIFELYFDTILLASVIVLISFLFYLIYNDPGNSDLNSLIVKVGFCVLVLFIFLIRSKVYLSRNIDK